ncbi:hypothetical protein [Dyadobacter pollutisoli]|uniref:Uncharacterized protein n=1 Tax=Dyadobacter pollutisoli TaxID=2910158 RepID=A0A9E8NCJ2_9BACT|nr:hypothetical protein [Dyadobacter pollutisoli]WAC14170.1 hypothetical protein ON006_09470 [Dyadobacter pollutisoli]
MRNSIRILLFGLTVLFVACDIKNEATPGPDDSAPQAAIAAVLQAFPKATSLKFTPIEANRVWQAKFAVDAARMAVYVNDNGKIYEATEDTGASDLPATLLLYIQKLYPKAIILAAGKSVNDGVVIGYKVSIQPDPAVKSEKTLLFDADGNITLDVDAGNINAEDLPTESAVSYGIAFTDLPEPVKAALAGFTFQKGLASTDDGKTTYHVFATKDGIITSFVFDGSGIVLKSYEEGPITNPSENQLLTADTLPDTIKAYLNKNYEGWTFAKGVINKKDGKVTTYLVLFLVTDTYYSAEFDAEGKLLTVQKL